MRGIRQERSGRRRPAGRRRVVGGVLRAADQLLGVVRRVVQLAALAGEVLEHDVEQEAGELQPDALAGDRGQREEALGHVAVVLQDPGVPAGAPVLGRTVQPGDGAHVHPDQQVGGLGGALDEVGPVEVRPGLGERGDRQAVPGGDHLVVPARVRARSTGGEQRGPHPGDPVRVRPGALRREPEHRGSLLEGALLRHPEVLRGEGGVPVAEGLPQLCGRPHVVRALDVPPVAVLAVGVERGGETALGGAQFADHEVGGLQGDPAGLLRAGGPPQVRVDPAEQRVVVEHLLEVGHQGAAGPLAQHVPVEAPAQLVEEARPCHGPAQSLGHLQRPRGLRPGVVAQQELDRHARREPGVAGAEPAALRVVLPADAQQRPCQLRLAGEPAVPVLQLPLRQIAGDLPGDLPDLRAPVRPGAMDAFEHLPEGRHPVPGLGREVRTEVEGLPGRRHEDGHGPAALPGGGLHGLHVDGVHVGALLAVHLDVDEVFVHVRGDGFVLEALVRHDVTPVARRVADRQQNGHIAPLRFLESVRTPGPPVDGILSMLKQIRRGHASQPVHAAQPLTAPGPTGETLTGPPRLAELHL